MLEILLYFLFVTPMVVYLSGIYRPRTFAVMMSIAAFLLTYSAVFVLRDLPLVRWILVGLILLMLLYHSIVLIMLKLGMVKEGGE